MKTTKTILIVAAMVMAYVCSSQNHLPDIDLYNLDGTKIKASEISNNGNPMVLIFWKTNVKECCNQLANINELYEETLKDRGVKVIAICMDCVGSIHHIKPFALGHNIDLEILIDKNGDFKRSMNVSTVPFTILYDQDMKVHCRYAGYCDGIKYLLHDKIEDCLANLE